MHKYRAFAELTDGDRWSSEWFDDEPYELIEEFVNDNREHVSRAGIEQITDEPQVCAIMELRRSV